MAFTAGRIKQISPKRFKITLLDDDGHALVVKEITYARTAGKYLSEQLDISQMEAEEIVYSSLDRAEATMFLVYEVQLNPMGKVEMLEKRLMYT